MVYQKYKTIFVAFVFTEKTNLFSIYPPLNQVKRQNILTSYTYKSFAARIELVLRESQEKINVEILQIGLAKNWTGKI